MGPCPTSIKNLFVKIVDSFNPFSANPIKWSNTLKQFVGNLPTNCLSVSDHFVRLALEGFKLLTTFAKTLYHRYLQGLF